ncbi:hypothetical protein GTP41_00485 [Pseudoduganella sp. DS3]|uniref:Uncharacterized protein n=1 Tax=Pseudoduganella guangdongensis TaxID=2692179 RepID=A0A6N9HBG0_9BURK|nr:DUF6587 family protein [Pseudoduganella guangdongensis]MYN00567.1 hypothetical protein [Pseudoduganella guangdongensis]
MWQEIIVGFVVAAAALHAARKYLPSSVRERMVFALARRGLPQDKLARFFKTEASCGSGCGSCGSCGDSSAPPAPPSGDGGPARRVIKLHISKT